MDVAQLIQAAAAAQKVRQAGASAASAAPATATPPVNPAIAALAAQLACARAGSADATASLLLAVQQQRQQQHAAEQQRALEAAQRQQQFSALQALLTQSQQQRKLDMGSSSALALAEAAISGKGSLVEAAISAQPSSTLAPVAAPVANTAPGPSLSGSTGAVSAAAALEMLSRMQSQSQAAPQRPPTPATSPQIPTPSLPTSLPTSVLPAKSLPTPHLPPPSLAASLLPALQQSLAASAAASAASVPVAATPAPEPRPLETGRLPAPVASTAVDQVAREVSAAPKPEAGWSRSLTTTEDLRREMREKEQESPAAKAKAAAVAAKARFEADKKRKQEAAAMQCHLHKKAKDNCKFCRRHQEFVNSQAATTAAAADLFGNKRRGGGDEVSTGARKTIEIANPKTFGFSPLLLQHIVESTYYQSTLSLTSVEQIVEEVKEYAKSVEPYMQDSTMMPSPFFCNIHRLFTMEPAVDGNQMFQLLDSVESPYIRCLGIVYLRFGLHADRLWGWLGEYILDDEEFQPTSGSGQWTTIGEFVEDLLNKEKYLGGALMPRVAGAVRRQLEERLAPVAQSRKRSMANREVLDVYRQKGTRVEACLDGNWVEGTVVELVEDFPSRRKVAVRLSDGSEEVVSLGKVILADPLPRGFTPVRVERRARSRSRSRDRTDWWHHKGKSDLELIDQLRQDARERAVCASGKEYSKRPTLFDKALAKPREGQGTASRRLLEEETLIKLGGKRRRSPSPLPEQPAVWQKEESAEHKERMRKLFEKYGNVKSTEASKSSHDINAIDSPDIMRFG